MQFSKKLKSVSFPYIIVTGAAGFIGSAVVRHLNDRKIDQLLLVDDIEGTDKWKNLVGKRFADFISKHELFRWLDKNQEPVKGIIHLGACSDTLMKDGDYLMENNYRYTVQLAERALNKGIRFIYASSAATYGDGSSGFSDDIDRLEELKPLNLYGFSKHLFDLWAKRQGVFDRIVGLKYFNVFGPNEDHKGHMASLVYKMIPKVKEEGIIRLFKSTDLSRFSHGEQCRDFIYVKNVAKMTCDFLDHEISGLFNIGTGQPTTWNQLAGAVFRALNRPKRIEYIDMPAVLMQQYQNYTCADMSKYFKTIGYSDRDSSLLFAVEDGVMDYVQNYLLKEQKL